jgi:16S rRNA (guanine527-N7)-methyltransferase
LKESIVDIDSYDKFCNLQYVSRETYEKFEIYYVTLVKWQKSINLISKSSLASIWRRHILDSAQLYQFTKKVNGNILDMGSGAGFPGIILAMMGNKNINLVESDQKKCVFMREVARLSNTEIKIHNIRIEDLEFINPDLITSRALAPLKKLVQYSEIHMNKNIKSAGKLPKLLFLKGKMYNEELSELKKTSKIEFEVYPSITSEYGKILYINKVSI